MLHLRRHRCFVWGSLPSALLATGLGLAACGGVGAEGAQSDRPLGDGIAAQGGAEEHDAHQEVRKQLLGGWRERLTPEDARVIELMKMALDNPRMTARQIQRLRLPPDDATNLQSFVGLLRADPGGADSMRKLVEQPGMRVRFEVRTLRFGRDQLEDVEVPYDIVAAVGDRVKLVLRGELEEETELRLLSEDVFEAPWGNDDRVLTFER